MSAQAAGHAVPRGSRAEPVGRAADRVLERASGGVFGTIARVRRARALHPKGVAFEGTVELRSGPGLALMAPPLDRPATLPALVRLSRGVGLRPPLPDFLGVAVRLPDLAGPGRPFDLLFTSSLGGPGGYHVLAPVRSFGWRWYSSVIPYRVGGRLSVLGALAGHLGEPGDAVAALDTNAPDALAAATAAALSGTLRFALAVARPFRPFVPFGELRVGAPLPRDQAAALRFDPLNTGGEIELAGGPLDALRAGAYRASRRRQPNRA